MVSSCARGPPGRAPAVCQQGRGERSQGRSMPDGFKVKRVVRQEEHQQAKRARGARDHRVAQVLADPRPQARLQTVSCGVD